ncbi:MAG: hypothetical protein IPO50_03735 [Sphingomonadales bacterium]|nr:hypothetical protein [Sphingomonadales bacterium]
MAAIVAYMAFAASCFAIPMLTSSGWAEVLHVRELAVGAAAITHVADRLRDAPSGCEGRGFQAGVGWPPMSR